MNCSDIRLFRVDHEIFIQDNLDNFFKIESTKCNYIFANIYFDIDLNDFFRRPIHV
jgi:hypothetical protein